MFELVMRQVLIWAIPRILDEVVTAYSELSHESDNDLTEDDAKKADCNKERIASRVKANIGHKRRGHHKAGS